MSVRDDLLKLSKLLCSIEFLFHQNISLINHPNQYQKLHKGFKFIFQRFLRHLTLLFSVSYMNF